MPAVFLAAWAAIPQVACAQTVHVSARSDLFDAGDPAPSPERGGLLPPEIPLPPRTIAVEFGPVTGAAAGGPAWPVVGPDGGTQTANGPHGTNVLSADGIAGLIAPRFGFLAGVFLAAETPPEGEEPPRLDFRDLGADFPSLAPAIAQTFFIGDGRTAAGAVQSFVVPRGATRLFLGYIDAFAFGWPDGRPPALYTDNSGSFTAEVRPIPACNADADLDGRVTVWDLLRYLGQFRSRDPEADRVPPATVDVADLLSFLRAYVAGC